jgi:D-alanyl-D-alanine carboxypeptidase (penicillin-binding protein 5/6)
MGRLLVTLDGDVLVDQHIVALEDVDQGGLFKRIWDWIKLFFLGLFG